MRYFFLPSCSIPPAQAGGEAGSQLGLSTPKIWVPETRRGFPQTRCSPLPLLLSSRARVTSRGAEKDAGHRVFPAPQWQGDNFQLKQIFRGGGGWERRFLQDQIRPSGGAPQQPDGAQGFNQPPSLTARMSWRVCLLLRGRTTKLRRTNLPSRVSLCI